MSWFEGLGIQLGRRGWLVSSAAFVGEAGRDGNSDACAGESAVFRKDDDTVSAGDVAFYQVLLRARVSRSVEERVHRDMS